MIQTTVAVCPFGELEVRSMHTEMWGTTEEVSNELQTARDAAVAVGGVGLTATISDACPVR